MDGKIKQATEKEGYCLAVLSTRTVTEVNNNKVFEKHNLQLVG